MIAPLETNFLVPDASFVAALFGMLVLLGLVVRVVVWLLAGRRSAAADR